MTTELYLIYTSYRLRTVQNNCKMPVKFMHGFRGTKGALGSVSTMLTIGIL